MTPHRRLTSTALGVTLLAVAPGAAGLAADAAVAADAGGEAIEGTLCASLAIDEINALSALRFVAPEPLVGDGDPSGSFEVCVYETAAGQEGPHRLELLLFEPPFEMDVEAILEAEPGFEPISVAGRPGWVDGTRVVVGLDGLALSVSADIADSAEAAGIDAVELAAALAELALAGLPEQVADPDAGPSNGPLTPPPVDGITWDVRAYEGEQIRSLGEDEVALFERLLEASDGSLEQAGVIVADALGADDESERVGGYVALRVAGADATELEPVLIDFLGLEVADASVAGRQVRVASIAGGEGGALLYAAGDTMYLLELPEATAALVLEGLP